MLTQEERDYESYIKNIWPIKMLAKVTSSCK